MLGGALGDAVGKLRQGRDTQEVHYGGSPSTLLSTVPVCICLGSQDLAIHAMAEVVPVGRHVIYCGGKNPPPQRPPGTDIMPIFPMSIEANSLSRRTVCTLPPEVRFVNAHTIPPYSSGHRLPVCFG